MKKSRLQLRKPGMNPFNDESHLLISKNYILKSTDFTIRVKRLFERKADATGVNTSARQHS